jgi:hypothetical protein
LERLSKAQAQGSGAHGFFEALAKDLLENKYNNSISDEAIVIHHGTAQSLAPAGPIIFPCSPRLSGEKFKFYL